MDVLAIQDGRASYRSGLTQARSVVIAGSAPKCQSPDVGDLPHLNAVMRGQLVGTA